MSGTVVRWVVGCDKKTVTFPVCSCGAKWEAKGLKDGNLKFDQAALGVRMWGRDKRDQAGEIRFGGQRDKEQEGSRETSVIADQQPGSVESERAWGFLAN